MGFHIFDDPIKNKKFGYKLLDKKLAMPDSKITSEVLIEFFPEEKKWNKSILPTESFPLIKGNRS